MEATVNVKQLIMFTIGTCLIGFGFGYVTGSDIAKSNVITRAKSFGERETYNYHEMEIVIFGESLEK